MTDPVPFVRQRPNPPPAVELDRVVAASVLREAEERFARGDRLVDAYWQEGRALPHVLAQRRSAARRRLAEALFFWLGIAVLGLCFAGLAVLIA